MAKYHRPDFEAFQREDPAQRISGTRYREAYMWPYINQEDLTKPNALLLLLNSRGRNDPVTFTAVDLEAMHMGLGVKAIVPVFLSNHVMMFKEATVPEEYGRLLDWDDHPEAYRRMSYCQEHGAGAGILILEVQARLMEFLVNCAREILPDISIHDLLHGKLQPEPPLISKPETCLASLAALRAESAYREPSQVDFSRIESLVAAKYAEVADHLWSLREDPGYFDIHMREALEHCDEVIKDNTGHAHPIFRKDREDVFWGSLLSVELRRGHLDLELWSEIHKQSVKIKELRMRHQAELDPEKDLPKDYLDAILMFVFWLNVGARNAQGLLQVRFAASPPWRPCYERVPVVAPTSSTFRVNWKPNMKMSKMQEHLLWLLKVLCEDDDELVYAGITNILDELQHSIEGSKEVADMFTPYLASIIADLSVITECLRQVSLYEPWAPTFKITMAARRDEILLSHFNQLETFLSIASALRGDVEQVLATYGTPVKIDFRYPVDKRRTRDNVIAMRRAEENLDKFWGQVDKAIQSKVGDMQTTAMWMLLNERRLERTPEWVEPSKEEFRRGIVDTFEVARPLSELYLDLEQRTERTLSKQTTTSGPKAKEKTRGEPSSSQSEASPEIVEYNIDDRPQPTFQVDARALKVFKTLFFTSSLTATPGEIPWTDFLHAMISTGFQAEKLYGSVWQFNPTKLDIERGIHFHEPHPSRKIPYRIARRHGRRLKRAYGWHGDMFKLAEKTIVNDSNQVSS